MSNTTRLRSFARALSVAGLVALASGCYAEAGAQPAYVEADAAPVAVEVAPRYQYEGRTVYYVNDRWYARDRGRWVYYRREPEPLYRQRVHVVRESRPPERAHGRDFARPRHEPPHSVRVQ